ncbi:hypothetical protein UFOVP492_14 [uncultured Caudovirales phage]|uniref:Uncharacterized protein n=1 Tax=uncultured Caudovirales phage TaxID=2100421 RepID=A0A6J5MFU8_9CAUD|nr:hypothetical protein UFOVP492_14 [uncultured Caudovirales phage]
MTKLGWTFKNQDAASYDFTSSVQSFTYSQGRQSVLDNYVGGTCQITMRNNAGQVAAASLAYRQKVYLRCNAQVVFKGWVAGITYIDTPGNANDATAVITLVDIWVIAGQQIAQNQVLVDNTYQVDEIDALLFYAGNFSQFGASTSIRGSLDYDSDYASRLNQIVASDRGYFKAAFGNYQYVSLDSIWATVDASYSFSSVAGAAVVSYESFNRIQAVGNRTYVNQAFVTPESLATQSHSNDLSTTVGPSAITVATLNTTANDGLNCAKWIANSMGDSLERQSYFITATDIAQQDSSILEFALVYGVNFPLEYKPPGGVSTTELTLTEGITVRGFIDRTEVDFYLSPYTYYNYFILNDTINGVLDSSRLGW